MHDDQIALRLQTACIVGILPRERIEPQPLQLELCLWVDLEACGDTGDLAVGVDYAAIDTQVRFLCTEGRFRLIETLALATLRLLLAPPAPTEGRVAIERASVRITKPAVLRAAEPSVCLARDAAWALAADPARSVLADVPEVCAQRIVLDTGDRVIGPGSALLLGPQPQPVALPFTAQQPSVLLEVEARA